MTQSSAHEIEDKVRLLADQVAMEAHTRFGKEMLVYWFGSWVNGNASPRSDLDIGLDLPVSTSPASFIDFVEWVEDLPTLYRFDIINMSDISDSFRDKIITTGQLI